MMLFRFCLCVSLYVLMHFPVDAEENLLALLEHVVCLNISMCFIGNSFCQWFYKYKRIKWKPKYCGINSNHFY